MALLAENIRAWALLDDFPDGSLPAFAACMLDGSIVPFAVQLHGAAITATQDSVCEFAAHNLRFLLRWLHLSFAGWSAQPFSACGAWPACLAPPPATDAPT